MGTLYVEHRLGVSTRLAALRTNAQQAKQLQYISEQEERCKEEDRRDQASKIAVWLQPNRRSLPHIEFVNAAQLPISQVSVFCRSEESVRVTRYATRRPTETPVKLSRASKKMQADFEEQEKSYATSWHQLFADGRIGVAISFMDVNERWWVRTSSGELRAEADGPAAAKSARKFC